MIISYLQSLFFVRLAYKRRFLYYGRYFLLVAYSGTSSLSRQGVLSTFQGTTHRSVGFLGGSIWRQSMGGSWSADQTLLIRMGDWMEHQLMNRLYIKPTDDKTSGSCLIYYLPTIEQFHHPHFPGQADISEAELRLLHNFYNYQTHLQSHNAAILLFCCSSLGLLC